MLFRSVYYGNGRRLEYDIVAEPGSDPSLVKVDVAGVRNAAVDPRTGDLILSTRNAELRQAKPVAFQINEGNKEFVDAAYAVAKKGDSFEVSFRLGAYDRERQLTIDPVLAYGSYLGGLGFDEGRSVAVDSQGNAYVVGTTASSDFPTTAGALKPQLTQSANGQLWYDAFVTKIDPTGTSLIFSTYYGGSNGNETGTGVALDAQGNILISGTTMSNDLPVVNAFQRSEEHTSELQSH